MVRVEGVLREFACWLAVNAPEVGGVADLRRTHIEAYKLHLATRPSARGGGALTKTSLAEHLGALRTCFERLTEWDGDDVPARVLVFAGDLPRRDEPLPRFLDDGAFAKLLQATRVDPDPFVRLLCRIPGPHRPAQRRIPRSHRRFRRADRRRLLAARAVGQAAQRPLHSPAPAAQGPPRRVARPPTSRPAQPLPVHRTRPTHRRRAASTGPSPKSPTAAGIGHVTPHRLRHTLATQAINRGMSLEAIAALARDTDRCG